MQFASNHPQLHNIPHNKTSQVEDVDRFKLYRSSFLPRNENTKIQNQNIKIQKGVDRILKKNIRFARFKLRILKKKKI